MIFGKKIVRQICAFLLAFALTLELSSVTVLRAADDWNNQSIAQSDAQTQTRPQASSAVTSGGAYPITASADETNAMDLYKENGGHLTLLGQGRYETSDGENVAYHKTEYDLKLTSALTLPTVLRVAASATVQASLLSIASEHLSLELGENADLTLIVSGECRIESIVLGVGAVLTIVDLSTDNVPDTLRLGNVNSNMQGAFTVRKLAVTLTGNILAESVTLDGTTLTGVPTSAIRAASDVTLTNAIVNAGESALGEISSLGNLSVSGNDTEIRAEKLGIAENGDGNVALAGIGKLDVSYLGAWTDSARAKAVQREMQINAAALQHWDYSITYQNYGASGYETVTPSQDAAVSYRLRVQDGFSMIVGYHTASDYHAIADYAADAISLDKNAAREHYEFRVWSLTPMADDADEASDKTVGQWLAYDGKEWDAQSLQITDAASPAYGYAKATITSDSQHVVLYAVYVPEDVIVRIHTNTGDANETVFATFPAFVGARSINLQPYLESDALTVQGQKAQTFSETPDGASIVNITDYRVLRNDGDGIADLYAVWSADMIHVTYKIPEFFPGYTYQYKDANGEWQNIPASTLEELNEQLTALVGAHDIYYGKQYGDLAVLRCLAPAGESVEYAFVGWYIESASGEKIMLDAETVVSSDTIAANALETGAQLIFAFFENARFQLTVPSSLSKWTFTDRLGTPIAFTDNGNGTMSAYVNSDTTVMMKRADESTVAAYWRLTNTRENTLIWPEETASSAGGSYWLSYEFTMPKSDVTAVYDETVRWDTAWGDYVFGTYEINGKSSYGFQIKDSDSGSVLHTFRWIMTETTSSAGKKTYLTTVYFTSSEETDHRIFLDAPTALYLDGVRLTARENAVDQLLGFYNANSKGVFSKTLITPDAMSYQNIIMDNNPAVSQLYNSTTSYTVTIHLLSDSKVFAIGQRCWINSILNNEEKTYRTTVKLNGNGHALDIYSLLLHTDATVLKECTINVLKTDNAAADDKIQWLHFDADDGTIDNCVVNANNRSIYTRFGGSLTVQGNGTSFTVQNKSVLNDMDEFHIPFLRIYNSTVYANEIRSIGYGYTFENSTIEANFLGYEGAVHTQYSNSNSTFNKCTITIRDWAGLNRPRFYGGTVFTVANGFYVFESMEVYGKSQITVGSFGRFRTIVGTTAQENKHYAGTDAKHFFYVNIYGGSTFKVNGDVDIGVVHSSMPEIKIYGADTSFEVLGNANIVNTVRLYNGASMQIGGDAVLHQDFEVKDGTTVLDVTGNLYHVTTETGDSPFKTVHYDNGTSEELYWTLVFADEASVSIGGNVGSRSDADRTNILYTRGNANFRLGEGGKVIRDIRILYTMPDGFENAAANPDNIRLENDIYPGETVVLQKPEKVSDSAIILEENCWFSGNTPFSQWVQSQTFTLYDGILRLDARVTAYLLTLLSDGGAIENLAFREADSEIWQFVAVSDSVSIPIDAEVRVTVREAYRDLVCAESVLGGLYMPVALFKTANGNTADISFTMNEMQIIFCAKEELTLYLDDGNVHVKEENGEIGFARYGGTSFVPYGGHLRITQRNTDVSCLNTLFIERNVDEDEATVTLQGIVILSNDSRTTADTVYFQNGIRAALHLTGNNALRNIRVPSGAEAIILGDGTSQTSLVKSPYFSGSYVANDTTRYYSQIGDYASGVITLRGGSYRAYATFNHQGSGAASVGGASTYPSGQTLMLDGITFISDSHLNPRWFAAKSQTILITDSKLTLKSQSAGPFICKAIEIAGDSVIDYRYNSGESYTASAFSSVTDTVLLKGNAAVEDFYINASYLHMANTPNQSMTVSENAVYRCHGNLLLKSLTVCDEAKLYVGNITANTDEPALAAGIAAQSVLIAGGEVLCGHLFVSGYVNGQAGGSELVAAYKNNTNIISGGTLTVTGGSLCAIGSSGTLVTVNDTIGTPVSYDGIIGGSRGANIQICAGSVSASVIGETDDMLGIYRQGLYWIEDPHPEAATVVVTDLENNALFFDILGGDSASVTLNGSTHVTMGENAAITGASIRITDDAHVFMHESSSIGGENAEITIDGRSEIAGIGGEYGKIKAPHGTLTVTGTSNVHVSLINLENGDVIVSTTGRAWNSDYHYGCGAPSVSVGLFVDYGGTDAPTAEDPHGTHAGDLAAANVTVRSGAYVSAYRLGSNAAIARTGKLLLESGSFIYTSNYGAFSGGDILVDREDGSTVNGKLQLSIVYNLNLGGSDERIEDIMPSHGVHYNFEPVSDANDAVLLTLPTPERKGYRFDGWFFSESSNDRVYTISTARPASAYLIAKWTPVKIWVHLKDDAAGLDEWLSLSYGDTSFTLPSFIVNGSAANVYTAQGVWQNAFGNALIQANAQKDIPGNLYDLYLAQLNAPEGVDYSDGLTEREKELLRELESIITEEDAKVSGKSFVVFKPDWTAVQIKVTFDARYPEVTQFRYGDVIRPITHSGSGKQEISYYIGDTYALGAYVGGEKMPGLPTPIRKGYNFIQWVNGSVAITEEMEVDKSITSFAAEYQPKTIRIYLYPSKDGRFGTFKNGNLQSETVGGVEVYYFDAVYDTPIGITLPDTQILSYVHEGWELLLSGGGAIPFDTDTVLRWDSTDGVIPNGFTVPNGVDDILVLTPNARRASIRYEMNGGSWTSLVTADLMEQFRLYTKESTELLPTTEYELIDNVYTIRFASDATKNSLVYRGYRFIGWTTEQNYDAWLSASAQDSALRIENYFAEADRLITRSDVDFADVTYYAVWKPCEYRTVLHSWDTAEEKALWENYLPEDVGSVTIQFSGTDAEKYITLVEGCAATLPGMEKGKMEYTPNGSNIATDRLLLGWMFDKDANPVVHYYNKDGSANHTYALHVAMAMNNKALFQDGDVFKLPASIQDPGDGGQIDLYAVYRERSLIFVHCTPTGDEKVVLISDYDVGRSGYVSVNQLDLGTETSFSGFELSGWYVNSKTPSMFADYTWYGLEATGQNKHPRHDSDFLKIDDTDPNYIIHKDNTQTYSMSSYTGNGKNAIGYDIYVYSYYAPVLTPEFEVYAQTGKNPNLPKDIYTIPDLLKVPASSTDPHFRYSVDLSGLDSDIRIVNKTVIQNWNGDFYWSDEGGTVYDANKTFALEMIVTTHNSTWSVDLTECTDLPSYDIPITAGSQLQIVVHSTKRLADTKPLGDVKIQITFPTIANAKLNMTVKLSRKAAVYEVVLNANTPDHESFDEIGNWDNTDIFLSNDLVKRDFIYGTAASQALPELSLEGYTLAGWKDGDANVTHMNYYPTGSHAYGPYVVGTLDAYWQILNCTLIADDGILESKNFTFFDPNGNPISIQPNGNGVYHVPYKTTVTMTTKTGMEHNGYPEFVLVKTENGGQAVPFTQSTDQAQSFEMPAASILAQFDRLKVIDAQDDVTVNETAYRIGTSDPVTWRGDYLLTGNLQNVTIHARNENADQSVRHTFTVSDTTSGVITLTDGGNSFRLYVDGDNALERIDAGNTALTLDGSASDKATLVLSPESGAAIASESNVTMKKLSAQIKLTGEKHTSGNVSTTAVESRELYLDGTVFTAVCTSPAASYDGTVLRCGVISITGGSVLTADANEGAPLSANARLVYDNGASILVNASTLSSKMQIACNTMTIEQKSTARMLGGNANVQALSLTVSDESGLFAYDALVKGKQTIAASADVIDHNGRHLDVKSGSVHITADGYTQAQRSISENRPFVLVGEKNTSTITLENPKNTIYLDGVSCAAISCEGNENIQLLSDSTIAGLTGIGEAAITIRGSQNETLTLTASGDVIAHTLTIRDCSLIATDHRVGSLGEGTKIGKVILDSCTVKADEIGALGEYEQTFTAVEQSRATVNGTLIVDHYRLSYEIDAAYDTSALPTVLRSVTQNAAVTYCFTIPNAPTAKDGKPSDFLFWYLTDPNANLYVLGDAGASYGFASLSALTDAQAEWTIHQTDGSRALRILAWMKPRLSNVVTAGRELGEVTTSETDVTIPTDGVWTARFEISGSVFAGCRYQIVLSSSSAPYFPKGTMLTLMDMSGTIPKYYYYECIGNETAIPLSSFRAMGAPDQSPVFLTGSTGSVISDILQISADFHSAENVGAGETATIRLAMEKNDGNVLSQTTGIRYSMTAIPAASVTVTDTTLRVQCAENPHRQGETTYLTMEIIPAQTTRVPYDVSVYAGNQIGERIGNRLWQFALGDAGTAINAEYLWRIDGLKNGEYTVIWRVSSASAGSVNVLANVLASTQTAYTEDLTPPFMSVSAVSINGAAATSRVLEHDTATTIVFDVNTNAPYTVSVEKQSVLGQFQALQSGDFEYTAETSTLNFPHNPDRGVYRVCFSLDEADATDNVYFTFIVE